MTARNVAWIETARRAAERRIVEGRIVELGDGGEVKVVLGGAAGAEPVRARVLGGVGRSALREAFDAQRRVLLVAPCDDAQDVPILVGVVQDAAEDDAPGVRECLGDPSRSMQVDGRRVEIEAAEELVLRCGDVSIVLRRDGRLLLRGVDVTSRAARTYRIWGGTVHVN